MQALVGAQAGGGFGVDQALVAGDLAQALGVDAGAVVLDFDTDVVAFLPRGQAHTACWWHPAGRAIRFANSLFRQETWNIIFLFYQNNFGMILFFCHRAT
ncbi:hypothetical protein GGR67_003403 [Xanthomonas arboricola]|nr:hypothetical protein [Xanthomonas euroxanthea]